MSTLNATKERTKSSLMKKFETTGLLREVISVPLSLPNGKSVPNKKAIVYGDDSSYIATVGSSYRIIQNEDILTKLAEALVESSLNLKGAEVSYSTSKTRARNLVKITLPEHSIETRKGDDTSLQILARNSYDGSWIQRLDIGGWRRVCANGQVIGDSMTAYANRHTQNHNIEEMAEYLSHAIDVFKEMGHQWLKMQKIKLKQSDAEDLILQYLGKRIKDPEDRVRVLTSKRASSVQALIESWSSYKEDLGSNAFALYNTLTDHASHVSDTVNPSDSEVIRGQRITQVMSTLIH